MERTELDQQVEQLIKTRDVDYSQCGFAASAILVKKGNQWQMVVDYRKLNENMESDRIPLPRAHTIFNTLGGATYFSSIDISQPIRPEEESICDA